MRVHVKFLYATIELIIIFSLWHICLSVHECLYACLYPSNTITCPHGLALDTRPRTRTIHKQQMFLSIPAPQPAILNYMFITDLCSSHILINNVYS